MLNRKPILMGAIMAPTTLWMLHGMFVGETEISAVAGAVFLGAHVLVAATVLAGALLAARLSPVWQARIDRLHRPTAAHLMSMMVGFLGTASAIHLILHGIVI